MMYQIFFIVVLCLSLQYGVSELFTAITDLRGLIRVEEILLPVLEQYIAAEAEKIKSLERFAVMYKTEHSKASEDKDTYLFNPLNSYLIIKRLTTDWKEVETLMANNIGKDYLKRISAHREYLKYPSDADLSGAAKGLARLQKTYNLNVSDLARGEINNVKYRARLSASDCFQLAYQYFKHGDYSNSRLWSAEAALQWKTESIPTISEYEILQIQAANKAKQGNYLLALELTNKVLRLNPSNAEFLGIQFKLQQRIQEGQQQEKTVTTEDPESEAALRIRKYEQLCRAEIVNPIIFTQKLKCRYIHMNNPFLLIAPFKIEEVYNNPKVLQFHDILSDNEIETLIEMSKPRLERATVVDTVGQIFAEYRISKSAWLFESEAVDETIDKVNTRIKDITGLSLQTAEPLQVVNYGIGGQYEPHYDSMKKSEKEKLDVQDQFEKRGQRIATLLIYMSDVPQGGATVFPNIDLTVWPKKGSAILWHNLHLNGDTDINTVHAGCPVLVGSKWVCNKWIHQAGNEFLRPCGLTQPLPEEVI